MLRGYVTSRNQNNKRIYKYTLRKHCVIINKTRKHRQSYRHAEPHRQRLQVAQDYIILVMITSNRATVTVFAPCDLDLLTSGLIHAERLLWSIRVPNLVLIAQAVLLLEHGQTDKPTNRQTWLNALPTPAAIKPAWVIIITAA